MVSARARRFPDSFECLPLLLVKVEVKEVIEVLPSLALVAAEEIKAIHVGDATGAAPRHRQGACRLNFLPPVLANAIGIQIVEALLIVGPTEEINVAVGEDAFVTGPRGEDGPL